MGFPVVMKSSLAGYSPQRPKRTTSSLASGPRRCRMRGLRTVSRKREGSMSPTPRSMASRSGGCPPAVPRSLSAPLLDARSASWWRSASAASGRGIEDITFRLAPATKDDALSMLDGIRPMARAQGRARRRSGRATRCAGRCHCRSLAARRHLPEIVELDLRPGVRHKKDTIARRRALVVDFDYKPRPAPRPTEEIVTAMNRIMQPKASP